MPPAHVDAATQIARNILPENNAYDSSPNYVRWAGDNGATKHEVRAMCNHFVNAVFRKAYGWADAEFTKRFGKVSPLAADWHDAIGSSTSGLTLVTKVLQIQAGDILVAKYPEDEEHSGHVMIATGLPVARKATLPLEPNTIQYTVKMVDSAMSGHGTTDTRCQPDGSMTDGAGEGLLRLYAAADGTVAGYSWSISSKSDYYSQAMRSFRVGRL